MGKHKRKHVADPEDEAVTELVETHDTEESVLYLKDDMAEVQVVHAIVAPDMHQCQCEYPDPSMEATFGPRPRLRCQEEPTVIAFQKRAQQDEPTGAISLCDDHRVLIDHMYPGQCYYRRVTPEKRIGNVL